MLPVRPCSQVPAHCQVPGLLRRYPFPDPHFRLDLLLLPVRCFRDPSLLPDRCFQTGLRASPDQAYGPDPAKLPPEAYFLPQGSPVLPEAWFPREFPELRRTEPPDLFQVPLLPDPLPPEPPVPPGK